MMVETAAVVLAIMLVASIVWLYMCVREIPFSSKYDRHGYPVVKVDPVDQAYYDAMWATGSEGYPTNR